MILLAALLAASVPVAEQRAIFESAGFKLGVGSWKSGNCEGLESASYEPGRVETYDDLNRDGRPEAVVVESGAVCYGDTGMHFWLLSKQANGSWKAILEETAMPEFLPTKGAGGWPDVLLGGPGLCFPVLRWNGSSYKQHRMEYDGKSCRN